MYIINQTLYVILLDMSHIWYEQDPLDHIQVYLNRMYSSMYTLKDDVDAFYEYLRLLVTQRLTPITIPPNILCSILKHVKNKIHSNAKVEISQRT